MNWSSSRKDLATCREVTVLYFPTAGSQKLAPAPDRTDIYEKMAKFLKLPSDRLSRLADHQRKRRIEEKLGRSTGSLV